MTGSRGNIRPLRGNVAGHGARQSQAWVKTERPATTHPHIMKTPTNLHLDTLAPGVLITFLRCGPDGAWKPSGVVRMILDYNERATVWRYAQPGKDTACGSVPKNGGGRDFMSKNPEPDYWVTANPRHVEKSARIAERKRKAAEKAAKAQAADERKRMDSFRCELDALLDKYGAHLSVLQTSGDDQGIDFEIEISIGRTSEVLDT